MIASEKILPLDELAKKLAEIQAQNLKVVLCHGVFDLLHLGHMRYFEQARKLGDFMVVTVTPNRFVNKGPQRPVFSEALRAEAIAAPASAAQINWAGSVSPSAIVQMTTPRAAPALTPNRPGSASGLRVRACINAPATPRQPPQSNAPTMRGRRICHRTM